MTTTRRQGGAAVLWWLVALLAVAGLAVALWSWAMLSWSYSSGERAGWVQKLSKKGWLCKTWEGDMAMVSMPGAVPEKFLFTVPDDAVADRINHAMGRRVSLHYEEHILLPTTCFGETSHFVHDVRVIEDVPAPMIVPNNPGALGAPQSQGQPPLQVPGPQPGQLSPAQPEKQPAQ